MGRVASCDKNKLKENKISIGENISGAIFKSLKVIAADAGFSHRAEKFIGQALKFIANANKITGSVYINRG